MNTNEKLRLHFVTIHNEIKKYLSKEINDTSLCLRVKNIVNDALAQPRRNCDVGTAKEQEDRFCAFCKEQYDNSGECGDCPLVDSPANCEFAWTQMPYEKEGEA